MTSLIIQGLLDRHPEQVQLASPEALAALDSTWREVGLYPVGDLGFVPKCEGHLKRGREVIIGEGAGGAVRVFARKRPSAPRVRNVVHASPPGIAAALRVHLVDLPELAFADAELQISRARPPRGPDHVLQRRTELLEAAIDLPLPARAYGGGRSWEEDGHTCVSFLLFRQAGADAFEGGAAEDAALAEVEFRIPRQDGPIMGVVHMRQLDPDSPPTDPGLAALTELSGLSEAIDPDLVAELDSLEARDAGSPPVAAREAARTGPVLPRSVPRLVPGADSRRRVLLWALLLTVAVASLQLQRTNREEASRERFNAALAQRRAREHARARAEREAEAAAVTAPGAASLELSAAPVVDHRLDPVLVDEVVLSAMPVLTACTLDALDAEHDLGAQPVTFEVEIAFWDKGRIRRADVLQATVPSANLSECVAASLVGLVGPAPKGAGVATARYSFALRGADPEAMAGTD